MNLFKQVKEKEFETIGLKNQRRNLRKLKQVAIYTSTAT